MIADDCFLHDKDRLKHGDAIALLRERMAPLTRTEEIPLSESCGKVLAQDIKAPRNIPAFDNAAVDGYAFAHAGHAVTGGFFPLAARIAAGDENNIELPGASAARIFTGAAMPLGADTVVMQEDCERHEQDGTQFIVIPAGLKKGANCRLAGEDVAAKSTVAKTGTVLRPQDLAAIASTGTDKVCVFTPLKVGLLSSGNELLQPGDEFENGKVYDANGVMLSSLFGSLPVTVTNLGVCPDDRQAVGNLLTDASTQFDVVISSGGASRGEEDHFVGALEKLGKSHMWQLAIKPGRPMSLGQIDKALFFVLPGNPVAAFVCFALYVRPSLLRLGGADWYEPKRFPLPADFSITSKPDRREFLRGIYHIHDDGKVTIDKYDRDGSGLISGLREADGLIEVSETATSVSSGDMISFIPFSELGI